MGRLEQRRKLGRLESRAAATRSVLVDLAEARKERLLSEAVARLSDSDLAMVGEILELAIEDAQPGSTTDLYRFASTASERRALRALAGAVAAVQSDTSAKLGEELASPKLTRGAWSHG